MQIDVAVVIRLKVYERRLARFKFATHGNGARSFSHLVRTYGFCVVLSYASIVHYNMSQTDQIQAKFIFDR
jgi:hypothetical protein